MSNRRTMGAVVLVAVLAVVGSACGDDDDAGGSDQRQEYVDAFEAGAEEDSGLSAQERTCVAESFVDGYGPAEIDEAGVTPDDIRDADGPAELGLEFSDEQKDAFYSQLTDCMDVRSLMLDALSEEADSPDEVRACLEDNLDDDLIRDFLVTGFTEGDAGFEDDPDLEGRLNAVFVLCAPTTEGTDTGA